MLLDNELHIGFRTRQNMRRLENENDITTAKVKNFHQAVRGFYRYATVCPKKFPLKDDALMNAKLAKFANRDQAHFIQVEVFLQRYPKLLSFALPSTLNKLEEEFLDYQLMLSTEIPEDIWKSAIKVDKDKKEILNIRIEIQEFLITYDFLHYGNF